MLQASRRSSDPNTGPVSRILIIRNAKSYDFGGGERFPVDLALELDVHQYETTVVSRSPKLLEYAQERGIKIIRGWWWSRQNWSGIRIIFIPAYFVWQLLLTGWYLGTIAGARPDVVHPQSKDDFIAATLAGKILGKRIVWTDHADLKYIYQNHTVWYKNPIGKLVYFVSRWADAITLVSHSEETLIQQALGTKSLPAQYRVIHNGATDQLVTPQQRPAADKTAFIFCATSRLVTAKGIGELIRAFLLVNKAYPDTRLWLAGDGPDAKMFHTLASNNEAITFFGHVTGPLTYVAASNAFVHPSYHEGFSLSLVEAAMLGKPIIACKVGGNPEIVEDQVSGLLVPEKNTQALAEAMKMLYKNHALANKLGKQARQVYEKSFQFEKIVAQQFVPLYGKRS